MTDLDVAVGLHDPAGKLLVDRIGEWWPWQRTFSRDPAALIATVALPVLIVQGEADLQVGVADAEALAQALPAAEKVVLPGMNHVLKEVPADDMAANFAAYRDPSLPLAPGLADAVVEFVARGR